MSEVVEGDGSKAPFVGDVLEHIRRCHERIVILHVGARALVEKVHRDLQIARDRVQQAETKAAAEKARADAAEAKFQRLAWLVRSQLLPAIEDEGFPSSSVRDLAQPRPNAREPSPERTSNERRELEYSVRGRLLEYRTYSEGQGPAPNAKLRHNTLADLLQLSLRHLRTSGSFLRNRPVFHVEREEGHHLPPEHDRNASGMRRDEGCARASYATPPDPGR